MSNLGWYQWFTTNAKKVGGPLKLMGLIALGGYAIIRTGEAGVKKGIKLIKKRNGEKTKNGSVYRVINSANIEEGVDVQVGDKIKVCAIDNDAVMIEILGNENNPYFIDMELLKFIVDYK
ncbi:MAG: hypothetical protein LUD07_04575 [Clostridiales bacterium]|nr:hypothetical protein [Clostridiales bacterium]